MFDHRWSRSLSLAAMVAALTCVVPALYAALGDCSVPTIWRQESKCVNLQWCIPLGEWCSNVLNPVNCPNGKVAVKVVWVSAGPYGTCQGHPYRDCFECPGDLVCAEGDGYEDQNCFLFACPIKRTICCNQCVGS